LVTLSCIFLHLRPLDRIELAYLLTETAGNTTVIDLGFFLFIQEGHSGTSDTDARFTTGAKFSVNIYFMILFGYIGKQSTGALANDYRRFAPGQFLF
jgi:hypothetical protein